MNSTLGSVVPLAMFIVSHCRHLAIFIALSPVLPRHPPPKFKRPPRLSPRWFAIPHLAGQQSEQAEILFITLQNSGHIQRKCPTVTVLNLRFLGSLEVGKLGSVDGTATVCQLQRWGASSKLAPGERWRSQTLTRSVHHQAEEKQGRSCVTWWWWCLQDVLSQNLWFEYFDLSLTLSPLIRYQSLSLPERVQTKSLGQKKNIDGKYCEKMLE